MSGDRLCVSFGAESLQRVQVVLALFFKAGLLSLHFSLRGALFAEPLFLFAVAFLLFGLFLAIVRGQLKLFDAETVVGRGNLDVHGATQPFDRRDNLAEAFGRCAEFVGFEAADEVVGLGVVGAEHQFREVAHHFPAFGQGAVDSPVGVA